MQCVYGTLLLSWSTKSSTLYPPGGGGGTASLRVGTQNKTTDPGSVLPQPSLTALAGLQPPIFEASKESLLLLLLLPWLAPSGHHFELS